MKLRDVSGIEVIKRLKKFGYVATRQKGSHVRLEKFDGEKTRKITVPLHRSLKIGTLLQIIKDAGLTSEEFERLK
ncbi:type II toxin-antitoxin system HicA family toxin [Candidatus Woesearchaeota archaeon]|nr:type II toxin-antitoxin system HicA family toxin [Candidatus Woesearchaeota archaeon]